MNTQISHTIEAIQLLIDKQLKPGDQLPPEKDLVQSLGVSRSTVRDALARLDATGIVERRWGVGTFVANPRSRSVFGLGSLRPGVPGLLATADGEPSVYRYSFVEEPPDPAQFPDFPHAPILRMNRVFALDGVPVASIGDRMIGEFNGRRVDAARLSSVDVLVVDLLLEVGIDFKTLDLEMWAADLDATKRQLFDLSRSEPVLETRGLGYDAAGRHFMTLLGIYRTSVIAFKQTIF